MFDSLLRPSQIRTNNDAGLLRLIACVCMCIDHAGKMLFPELTWMRLFLFLPTALRSARR